MMSYILTPNTGEDTMKYSGIECFSNQAIEIEVAGTRISAIRHLSTRQDLPILAPGFFDIQINGYTGHDYTGPDLSAAAVEKIVRGVALSGTTRHLATIITAPRERIAKNCGAIAAAVRKNRLVRSAVPGIHIEGPYIASEDGPRGAHDLKHVRKPDFDEFSEWQDRAEGLVKLVTVAPELEGALDFIEKISAEGVVAAIGHTGASPERIRDAVKAGARLSTHLGNGSHRLVPRLKNYLWEQLSADELNASIIADGFHLPDPVLKAFDRAKQRERLVLISDVNYLAGHAPGILNWGDIKVEIHPDGHMSLAGTEFLAGAGHLLDRCLAQYLRAVGCPLAEAVCLCTRNPARLLGLPENTHRLAAGSPAHFVLFRLESGRPALKIETCVIEGEEICPDGA